MSAEIRTAKPLPRLTRLLPYCPLPHGCALRPTFYGFVYLGMVLALLLGSINYNNNLGYLLTFLLGGLLLVSLRQTWLNVQDVLPVSARAEPAFAGGVARVLLQVRAESEHLALQLSLAPDCQVLTDVAAGALSSVELALPVRQRGLQRCEHLTVASTFPFGLVECQRQVLLALSCLVYPKPIRTAFVSRSQGDDNEARQSAHMSVAAGFDFSGINTYRPGDSLNRIHWKSLARGQGLHVTEFEEENRGGAFLALALIPGGNLEHRLSRLCHLVLLASSRDLRYGLDLGTTIIQPDHGPRHRERCLEALALYPGGARS